MNGWKSNFTHFISIPLNESGELTEKFAHFKRSFVHDKSLNKAFVAAEKLHLTLAMLDLSNKETRAGLIETIGNILLEISLDIRKFPITLRNLGLMRGTKEEAQVLHLNIDSEDKGYEELAMLNQRIKQRLVENSILTDTSPFHPHVTLMNTKYVSRNKRITFDATGALNHNENLDWGNVVVSSLHISKIQTVNSTTGYYQDEYRVDLTA